MTQELVGQLKVVGKDDCGTFGCQGGCPSRLWVGLKHGPKGSRFEAMWAAGGLCLLPLLLGVPRGATPGANRLVRVMYGWAWSGWPFWPPGGRWLARRQGANRGPIGVDLARPALGTRARRSRVSEGPTTPFQRAAGELRGPRSARAAGGS